MNIGTVLALVGLGIALIVIGILVTVIVTINSKRKETEIELCRTIFMLDVSLEENKQIRKSWDNDRKSRNRIMMEKSDLMAHISFELDNTKSDKVFRKNIAKYIEDCNKKI